MNEIDVAALHEHLRKGGPWARESGDRLRSRRETFGYTPAELAAKLDVTITTIKMAEAGDLVPREHLRAALAGLLRCNVADIWPPMKYERIEQLAAVPA